MYKAKISKIPFASGAALTMGLLLLTAICASGIQLVVHPYLTWVEQNSITIQWETDAPGSSAVEYGLTEKYGQVAESGGLTNMHKVVVTNLTAGTLYHYRIKTQAGTNEVYSPGYSFATAPGPTASFRFAFLADTHTSEHDGPVPPKTRDVANGISARNPDIIVSAGDSIQGTLARTRLDTEQQYRVEFFNTSSNLITRRPYFTAIGDHNRRAAEGDRVFAGYFAGYQTPYWGKTYYTFTYGPARFIVLDCVITNDHVAGVEVPGLYAGGPQYKWLENVLAGNTSPWIFMSYHYATYHSHPRFQPRDRELRAIMGPLCDRYGVAMVMTGHAHLYERSHPIRAGVRDDASGTVYVVSGTGGGGLMTSQPGNDLTATNFSTWGYGIVAVSVSNLNLTFYDLKGAVRDSCVIPRRMPGQAAPKDALPLK